jgi:hypothetical protein
MTVESSEGKDKDNNVVLLDVTGDVIDSVTPVSVNDYDPDQSRDVTRQTITLWLIGLLCTIIGLTFAALFARGASNGFANKEFFQELKQVLDVVLGPVTTLLASAVGYYFGYKQSDNSGVKK